MAIFYVQYEDAGGSRRWMPVQADSGDQARDEVAAMGFGVLRVATEGEDIDWAAGRRPVEAPEPWRPARVGGGVFSLPPAKPLVEYTGRDVFWLLVKSALTVLFVWWVFQLLVGAALFCVVWVWFQMFGGY